MKASYKEGDLVEIVRRSSWSLCISTRSKIAKLRECPAAEVEVYSHPPSKKVFEPMEGKVALVVEVRTNHIHQTTGYRVLIEGKEMFCKSKIAHKYFKLQRVQSDECGRFGAVQDE
jgi:hypothetical protein